jgi:hypothetical protein
MSHNRSAQSRVSPLEHIEDSDAKQSSPPSLAKMVAGIAIVNLLVALCFAAFPNLYPNDAQYVSRFTAFVTEFSLPICTVQLAIVWIVFFIRKP